MRKIYSFMVAAVAVFAAASCAKELPQENLPAGETVVYSASFDQAETKAVLNETRLQSEWVAGDAITVLDGTKGWEFTTADAGANADFTNSEGFGDYRPVLAVYPKGAWTANLADKTVNAYISTWQQAQKGTYHADAALAVAYSENNEFSFKNAHALLKFQVNADKVTHLVFHGNAEEAITGNMLVTLADDNTIESVVAQETEFDQDGNKWTGKGTWVECYAWQSDDEKYFEKDVTYYVAIAPAVFENGVSVRIKIDGGNEILVKTTENKVEAKRSTILDLGTIEYTAPGDGTTGWSLPGGYNDWSTTSVFLVEEGEFYVAKNVTVMDGAEPGFKFQHADFGWKGVGAAEALAVGEWHKLNGDNNITLAGDNVAYDIYMTADGAKFQAVAAGSPAPAVPEEEPVADNSWGIVGVVNTWGETADIALSKTETEGLFVAQNVAMPTGGFKIRANGEWNDAANYGLETAGAVEVDHVYDVVTSGGSGDMTLAAGTYDIWFDLTNKKVYIMTPGKPISEAVAGSGNAGDEKPGDDTPGVEGEASIWGIVGIVNGWGETGSDIKMVTTSTPDLFVARSVEMPDGGFKIRANGTWNDAANYGLETAGEVKVNCYYNVVTSGGSGDMTLAAGTYDIWFDLANTRVYIMTPGRAIGSAAEGKVEAPLLDTWYLVGTFNSWNTKQEEYKLSPQGSWYVIKNVSLENNAKVKVCNGTWNVNRGGSFAGVGKACSVSHNGADIIITSGGTYDIYLNSAADKLYFMTPGQVPAN